MTKLNLIVDVALCNNCNNCVLATKDEYVGNEFPGYSQPHAPQGVGVVRIERTVRGSGAQVDTAYLPRMCNHCDNPPCMRNAGNAIRKREDGIVIIDPVHAKGRRDLVNSCPYGAIVWNEALQLPQNWIFDAHLLDDGWQQPRCAQACPTNAIEAVKVSDAVMQERQQREQLRTLQPELATQPRVYYRNLHRVDQCFIAGTVLYAANDTHDCCEGAAVYLMRGENKVSATVTNAFGEFTFDRIPADSGEYVIEIAHPVAGTATALAVMGNSRSLGTIMLTAN